MTASPATAALISTTHSASFSVRGILGTLLVLSCNVGVVTAFVLGYYFNYATVAWIVSVLSLVFLVCFWFMPETPQHLAQKHKLQEAEHALRYYRNIRARPSKELSEQLQLELHKLRAPEKADEAGDDIDDSAVTWSDFGMPNAACKIHLRPSKSSFICQPQRIEGRARRASLGWACWRLIRAVAALPCSTTRR